MVDKIKLIELLDVLENHCIEQSNNMKYDAKKDPQIRDQYCQLIGGASMIKSIRELLNNNGLNIEDESSKITSTRKIHILEDAIN